MNSGRPDDCEVQAFHTATVSGPFDEQPADTCIRSKALWCNNIYRAPGLAPAPRIPRPEP
jgi:hypothetical protein